MAEITVIRSLVGVNANSNETDCFLIAYWDSLDTVTRAISSGVVEALVNVGDNAQQCEVKIRDAVTIGVFQQTGRTTEVGQMFQHSLRRG